MKKTLGILAVAILALCFLLTIADQVEKLTAQDEQVAPCPWQKSRAAVTGTSGDKAKPEQNAVATPCPEKTAAKTPEATPEASAGEEEIKTPADLLKELGRPAMGYDAAGPQPGDRDSVAAAAKPGMALADELAVRNRALDEARAGLLARNRQIERQQERIHALEEHIAGLVQELERQRARVAKQKQKVRTLKSARKELLETLDQLEQELWHVKEECTLQHSPHTEEPPVQDESASCRDAAPSDTTDSCGCDKESGTADEKSADEDQASEQEEIGTPSQPGPQSAEPDNDLQQDDSSQDAPSGDSEPSSEQDEPGCPGAIETPSHPM